MNIKTGDVVELRQPGGNIIVTVGQVRGDHFIDMTGNRFMTRTVINLRSRVPNGRLVRIEQTEERDPNCTGGSECRCPVTTPCFYVTPTTTPCFYVTPTGFIDVPYSTHEAHGGGPTALDGVCEACGWIDESGNEPESHLPMGADVEHLVTGPHPDKITFKVDTDKLKVAIEQIKAKRHDPFSAYTDLLVEAELDERPLYAYVIEDEITTGTLVKYAKDLEAALYSDLCVGNVLTQLTPVQNLVSVDVWHPEFHEESISRDDEGYPSFQHNRVVVRDRDRMIIDAADYAVDLRA